MYYSSFGILAIILHIIINYHLIVTKDDRATSLSGHRYKWFLINVLIYYVIDASWGIIYDLHIIPLIYTITVLYFASIAFSVLLWCRFVVAYMGRNSIFSKLIPYAGWTIFVFQMICLVINLFYPILFRFTSDGIYEAMSARYISLAMQVVLFLVVAAYSYVITTKSEGKDKIHNKTICASGLALASFIVLQTLYPYFPLYAIGLLISITLNHSFIEVDEKTDREIEMDRIRKKEKAQKKALLSEKELARRDELTGTKNKTAFTELEQSVQNNIDNGIDYLPFALAVCDINNLKKVNDTLGHQAGDEYIKAGSKILCDLFSHSPVFRIGGDEFVIFLRGEDYTAKDDLLARLRAINTQNSHNDSGPVIAHGSASFEFGFDKSFSDVFERADMLMYEDKRSLKKSITF